MPHQDEKKEKLKSFMYSCLEIACVIIVFTMFIFSIWFIPHLISLGLK